MDSFKLGTRKREGGALRYCVDNWINGRLDNCSDIDRGRDDTVRESNPGAFARAKRDKPWTVSIIPRGSLRGGLSTYTIVCLPMRICLGEFPLVQLCANCAGKCLSHGPD